MTDPKISQPNPRRCLSIHYHLGRLLAEHTKPYDKLDLSNSSEVSDAADAWGYAREMLDEAQKENPNFTPVYYYLGKAIYQLGLIVNKKDAKNALLQYEKEGAPIGFEKEVAEYLAILDETRLRSKKMQEGLQRLKENNFWLAEACFQEAKNVGASEADYFLGEIYSSQRNWLRAANAYQLAKRAGVSQDKLNEKLSNAVLKVLNDKEFIEELLKNLSAEAHKDIYENLKKHLPQMNT